MFAPMISLHTMNSDETKHEGSTLKDQLSYTTQYR